MNLDAASAAVVLGKPSAVSDLTLLRLQRSLRARLRYRYVRPTVLQEGEAFRIQSPNCSRKVDPHGGVIDIALLVPHADKRWCLCARNHAEAVWVPRLQNAALSEALDALCADPERQFWP